MSDTYQLLSKVDIDEHVEQKKSNYGPSLSYLSWAWAWAYARNQFPDCSYEIERFNGVPYHYDQKAGYLVMTKVTIQNETHEMWLPVMDGNNNAMLDHPYEYQTKNGKRSVEAATMFDINKAIMRCLVKNLAMFGLGLELYAGEDLPSDGSIPQSNEGNAPIAPKTDPAAELQKQIKDVVAKLNPANTVKFIDWLKKHNADSIAEITDPKILQAVLGNLKLTLQKEEDDIKAMAKDQSPVDEDKLPF